MSRISLLHSFLRAQISSFVAGLVDFGTLIVAVEVFHIWYVAGTALGALFGAVTNFFLGRYWSFVASDKPVKGQAFRYTLVSIGSLLLNSGGVYLMTEYLKSAYWVSRIVVSFLVGISFNFFLHRRFVFSKAAT